MCRSTCVAYNSILLRFVKDPIELGIPTDWIGICHTVDDPTKLLAKYNHTLYIITQPNRRMTTNGSQITKDKDSLTIKVYTH